MSKIRAVIIALGLLLLPAAGLGQRIDSLATRGRYLSAGMTLAGLTQDSLARLLPASFGSSQTARVARLSAMRNGRAFESDSVFRLVGAVLLARFYEAADTAQILWAQRNYATIARARRPPAPPAPPPAPMPSPILRSLPIAYAQTASNPAALGTYRLNVHSHGMRAGDSLIVRNHAGAVPSLDGRRFFVLPVDSIILWLWLDPARTQPVRVTTPGTGGSIDVLR